MNHDPVTRWLAGTAVVLLIFILSWALISSARAPSIHDRLDSIEHQIAVLTCLALVPDAERPEAIATCQGAPAP
jgi:hypothetical protein